MLLAATFSSIQDMEVREILSVYLLSCVIALFYSTVAYPFVMGY